MTEKGNFLVLAVTCKWVTVIEKGDFLVTSMLGAQW